MNQTQILNYFGPHIIYQFDGSVADLEALLGGSSINYIAAAYVAYFIADKIPPADSRITVYADNTEGGV